MTSERLQGEEQLSTNFGDASFLCQNAREKCTRKTELCKCKSSLSISYTLNCSCKCPCTFPHSYA